MDELEHTPDRPYWDCRACGRMWPCPPAREHLASELDSLRLSIYAWNTFEEAVRDIPTMPMGEAYERFIAWTRPRPAEAGGSIG